MTSAADKLRAALDDLIGVADFAMSQANNDGGEFDRDGELKEARDAIKAYDKSNELSLRQQRDVLREALAAMLSADLYADGEGVWRIEDTDTEDGERAVAIARKALKQSETP